MAMWWTALALLIAWGCAAPAWAAEIKINLPYHIGYELTPIEIELTEGPGAYRIYDVYKTLVAEGETTSAAETVTFTPPKYGWYLVAFGDTAKFIGVTPEFPNVHTLVAGEMTRGWNNEPLQAFSGLMLDRTNTRMGVDNANRVVRDCQKYGVTLLMQFEGPGHATADHVREWVTRMKGKVKNWEVINEPNFSMNPVQYVETLKVAYSIIKSVDPQAVVMGPNVCGVNLGWNEAFLKAGGADYIDALSVHDYEGDEAIDPFHWMWKMGELRKIMATHGAGDKPIWQTERAIGGVRGKVFLGPCQAVRITLQRDLLELFGVTNDHNSHYYADVTGYMDVPTFIFSDSGPHPAALACRTRHAMTQALGRKFVKKLDFGPTGNKMFLGLLYTGADGSTVTLRNLGTNDLFLVLRVTGGKSVDVVDSFGNVEKVPVRAGKARVSVTQLPIYLRLRPGQKVAAPVIDLGKNIASEATFTYSGGSESDPALLTDGIMQVWHGGNPWGSPWKGGYPGTTFNESPQTFDITFSSPRKIGALAIFGARADNPHSALLDYDVQYHNGRDWVTLEEVRAACPPSDALKTLACETVTWYLDNNFYIHQFAKPVTTDKLRLVIRRITIGFMADIVASRAAGYNPSGRWLGLREVEVYGVGPASSAAFGKGTPGPR